MKTKKFIKKETIIHAIKYTLEIKQDLLDLGALVQVDDILVVDTPSGAKNIYIGDYIVISNNIIVKVYPKGVFEQLYDRFDEAGGKRFIRGLK